MLYLNDVMQTINMYFPKDTCYDKPDYKLSSEYLKNISKREKVKTDDIYANHLDSSLKSIFNKFEIMDWTDKESFKCYEYRILLHQNQPILDDDVELMKALGGERIDLFLFVSALNKYYYYFTNRTSYNLVLGEWKFEKMFNYPQYINPEIESLQVFLKSEGYEQISNEIAHEMLENVETEFIEKGKVKVFNCLFTDLITI